MDLASLVHRHARYRPDHLAVVVGDTRLSWRAFHERVGRLVAAFGAMGLGRGDRVATLLPNSIELVEAFWACAAAGLVLVPQSPLLRAAGLASLLSDAGVHAIVGAASSRALFDELRGLLPGVPADRYLLTGEGGDPSPFRSHDALVAAAAAPYPDPVTVHEDDPFNIIYSSGTTGQPKGIIHTHRVRALYGTLFASAYRMTPESVVMHAGALVFNGAMLTFLPAFFLGATYILQKQFAPATFVEAAAREQVTHVMLVPSQIIALLGTPGFDAATLPSLRMIGSVGAPLHREHKDELCRRFPGCFSELYGLTEGFMTVLDPGDIARKPGSVGCPLPFFEMRIVGEDGRDLPPGEVGEIVGRGPLLMPGYHGRPDLTAEAIRDGWLFTGDMGRADEDGFLYLVDRKKELIISGGVNVYPRDIEEIAVAHPAVREAAAFGVPHEKWGETPVVAVVLHAAGGASADELRAFINARVAARYQQVHEVVIHDEFPRNTAGKTMKRLLRDPYWAGHGRSI
jgi:acyl-CoA synthetase (AMP-forming)/AMP-acid ligase II